MQDPKPKKLNRIREAIGIIISSANLSEAVQQCLYAGFTLGFVDNFLCPVGDYKFYPGYGVTYVPITKNSNGRYTVIKVLEYERA